MTKKRFRKLKTCVHEAPPAEHYGPYDAAVGLITWGSTYGTAVEAVKLALAAGLSVACMAPKMLWPLPGRQIEPFLRGKHQIIVPEVNYSGQFAELLQARYALTVRKVNTYGGMPFTIREILSAIEEACEEVLQNA